MMYIGVCIVAVMTGLADLTLLARKRRRRELVVAAALLFVGFVAAQIRVAQLPVPTIGEVLKWLARPFLGPL